MKLLLKLELPLTTNPRAIHRHAKRMKMQVIEVVKHSSGYTVTVLS